MTTTVKEFTEETTDYIAKLMKDGKSPEFIVDNLAQNGYDREQSMIFMQMLTQRLHEKQKEKESSNAPLQIVLGVIILIIGIAVTASGSGIIAYGAIIVGIIKIIAGIVALNN